MNYAESDRALTVLKRQPEVEWLNEPSSAPLQQALRDLQAAFSAFFEKRAQYPAFKRKGGRAAARYTKSVFRFEVGNGRLILPKMGALRVKWDRPPPSYPSSVTVIREPTGRYYVSLVVETLVAPKAKTKKAVGVDFGIARLATLSTGDKIANPQHLRNRLRRLACLQKKLARKQKGSRRRWLALRALARCHEKIRNARKDTLHSMTTQLVTEFDVICIEDLNLRGMAKNHSLARSLSDAGIGMAIQMLEEKSERYGKRTIRVDRFFPSSKMCSTCGHINAVLTLADREWDCQKCATHHDRDLNASQNILAVGQTVAAHGDGVRATSASAEGACCR